MSLWRQLARGVRALSNRAAVDAELDDEVRDYFERVRADLVEQGLTAEEAERVARRELGDLGKTRETLRAYGWENHADATLGDFRQSSRRLRQNPSFSAIVVTTLAVGIGANVALFSLFQQILLRPLTAVAQPERLVNLVDPGLDLDLMRGVSTGGLTFGSISGNRDHVFSYPMFRDLERRQETFAGLAAHRIFDASLSIGESARRVTGFFVSGSYFPVLGLRPALGRLLGPEDDRVDGQAESVVLSHAYWQRELGGDPGVLGRKLTVNGAPLTIVGVARQGFHGTTVGARASVFVPITFRGVGTGTSIPNHDNRGFYWVYLFARLASDMQPETAASAIDRQYKAILNEIEAPLVIDGEADSVEAHRTKSLVLAPGARGQSALLRPIGAALEVLFAVSGAVLLLCCANVAGLVLIRATSRTGEMAVRASMGASRGRLASLLLTESLLLAVPAALLSLPVALLMLRGLAAGIPGLPSEAFDVELSGTAAVVAIAVALIAAVGFGLVPVRDLARTEPARTLHAYGARQTAGKRVTRFRAALATAQIALSMALLALTGVFAASLGNIAGVELGLDIDSVAMFTISPEGSGYAPAASAALFDRLEDELGAVPGVIAAASAQIPLLAGGGAETGAAAEGSDARTRIHLNSVSSDFFRTLDVGLLAGREFSDADGGGAPPVAIINQRLAESLRFDRNAIGQRIRVFDGTIYDVVGVVPDVQYGNVQDEVEPQVFRSRRQQTTMGTATFYVRGARPPGDLLDTVRETVARAAPTVPITDLRTMEQQVNANLATERFVAGASTAFAVLATALAGLGLYGVLAYSVAQRSREIALRFALGAPAARIRAMVLHQVGAMALLGLALGVVAALLLGRAARGLLYGVEAADPIALLGAAIVLACVMLGAAYIPARRATRVDPIVALRYE